MAFWGYVQCFSSFSKFQEHLRRKFECESSIEDMLSLRIFMAGCLKREKLQKSDTGRFFSAIVLVNALVTGSPLSQIFKQFKNKVKNEYLNMRKVSFYIKDFQKFLFHLKQDLKTAQKVLYSLVHEKRLVNVITNHFQFKDCPSLLAITKCSDLKIIRKSNKLYPTKTFYQSGSLDQISLIFRLPNELLVKISSYLEREEKISFLLTCRHLMYVGATFFKLDYLSPRDLAFFQKSPCRQFEANRINSVDSNCSCLLCVSFCPCDENPMTEYYPSKKFLLSNLVFNEMRVVSKADFKLCLRYLFYIPSSIHISFPMDLPQLQMLFRFPKLNSVCYLIDTQLNYPNLIEADIRQYLQIPPCRNIDIGFAPIGYKDGQTNVSTAILKGHLRAFTKDTECLESLSLTNCHVIDNVFRSSLFKNSYTWFKTITSLEIIGAKMSCRMLKSLPYFIRLVKLWVCDITITNDCESDHFNRHLRADFHNFRATIVENEIPTIMYIPQRFPPLQIFADTGLLCSCPDFQLSLENFEQYRNNTVELSTCFDCTLNFGCNNF